MPTNRTVSFAAFLTTSDTVRLVGMLAKKEGV
jgi:hypothetical protein